MLNKLNNYLFRVTTLDQNYDKIYRFIDDRNNNQIFTNSGIDLYERRGEYGGYDKGKREITFKDITIDILYSQIRFHDELICRYNFGNLPKLYCDPDPIWYNEFKSQMKEFVKLYKKCKIKTDIQQNQYNKQYELEQKEQKRKKCQLLNQKLNDIYK